MAPNNNVMWVELMLLELGIFQDVLRLNAFSGLKL